MQSSNDANGHEDQGRRGPPGTQPEHYRISNVDNGIPSDREPGEPAAAKALGAPPDLSANPGASRGERYHRGRARTSPFLGDGQMTVTLTLDTQTFLLVIGLIVWYRRLRK